MDPAPRLVMLQPGQTRQISRTDFQSPWSSDEEYSTPSSDGESTVELADQHLERSRRWLEEAVTDELFAPIDQHGGGRQHHEVDQVDASIYTFRLFSRSNQPHDEISHREEPTRIDIHSPGPEELKELLTTRRSESYYFAGPLSSVRRTELEESAVTGEEVLKQARLAWPGCSLPWRVATITSRCWRDLSQPKTRPEIAKSGGQRRLGKKSRIARRKKVEAIAEKQRRETAARSEKEAAMRDKRARKNRLQKLRRRAQKQERAARNEGQSPSRAESVGGGPA